MTVLLVSTLLLTPRPAPSQTAPALPDNQLAPRSWVVDAVANETAIVDRRDIYLRYHSHRIDAKGDTVRDVMETPQGPVRRLILRNGKPLTPQEDAAERDRLNAALNSPKDFARHHQRDDADKKYTLDLVKLMPDAMLYSYAPGQPQLPGIATPQVVLDFKPNPAFHPPNTAAELLPGIAGRVWIDSSSRRMVRIECNVIRPINLGFGILARVAPGGKLEFEQTDAGGGAWVYSRLVFDHLTVRALVFKTENIDSTTTDSDFERLPGPMPYQQAIQRLLDTPLPTP